MCSLHWHICECGSEWNCDQKDDECPTLNGFDEQCFHCEHQHEEELADILAEENRKDDAARWIEENGFRYQ